LTEYCDNFNNQSNHGFSLVIAHGYVEIKDSMPLSDAIDMADALMYQNKRELKERYKKEA
jgi:hypothetical protein